MAQRRVPSDVGGYVLAGGKSSRMGRDKALLELAGRPLVWHAVKKLRRVCADVQILSGRTELEEFAPLVRDMHEGCGPMGGLETALGHSWHQWNLILPVDMPFLPSAFLDNWVRTVLARENRGARIAMFTVDGVPQPLFCVLHREVTLFVHDAMQRGEYKVFPALEAAGRELAARQDLALGEVLFNLPWDANAQFSGYHPRPAKMEAWWAVTEAQQAAKHLWFANLNTPEEFAEAEKHLDALDT
jgi:molybdopterin-guanine dinucleotide biosynthesis protein A